MKVSFEYSSQRRSDTYKQKKQVIIEKKKIGKVRKRRKTIKKVTQEDRIDRPPTRKEIKVDKISRKSQVTRKSFTTISTEVVEDIVEKTPTLEVLSIEYKDVNEFVTDDIPVMDIEFVKSDSIPAEEVHVGKCNHGDLIMTLERKNQELTTQMDQTWGLIKEQGLEMKELEDATQANSKIIEVYQSTQVDLRDQIAKLKRQLMFNFYKCEMYKKMCRCGLRIDESKIQDLVQRNIDRENEIQEIR